MPSKLIHSCTYLTSKDELEDNETMQQNFIDTIFDFVGEKNLSIRTAASQGFREILEICYKYAQKNPETPFSTFYLKIGRKTFTEKFIERSKILKKPKMNNYVNSKYASLLLDAGTINQIPYVTFIISRTDTNPLVVKNLKFFKDKTLDYKTEIKAIIDVLKEQGIIMTSFVADNLIAQKNALESFFENILNKLNFFKSDNPGIIFCPCQCHTLSLAIKDLKKKKIKFLMV